MATLRNRRFPAGSPATVKIYEDARPLAHEAFDNATNDALNDSRDTLGESDGTRLDENEDEAEEEEEANEVLGDMQDLEQSFAGFSARFKLLDRIGEGV